MAKPEIIGSSRSTYTRAVLMVCEEKGIDYVLTEKPLHAPEIRAIHPFGKMPVLRHEDVELFESKAIVTWLDRNFPAPFVLPSEARQAALVEQWISLVNTVIDRTLVRTYLFAYISPGTPDGKPNRAAIDAVLPAVREQVGVLDRAVEKTGHLVGENFTFADINLLPILHRLQQAPEGGAVVADTKYLSAYYARHAARPSFKRTDPPPRPAGPGEEQLARTKARARRWSPAAAGRRSRQWRSSPESGARRRSGCVRHSRPPERREERQRPRFSWLSSVGRRVNAPPPAALHARCFAGPLC